MGKNRNSSSNQRGNDKSSYQHGAPKTTKHSKGHALSNPARESDERRIFLRNKIEIKRLVTNVQKKKAIAQGEVPTSSEKKDDKKDDLYQLKGAARPAAEHYAPKVEEEPPKPDLFVELKGRLWEATEGQDYLTAVFEYATALHNLMNKSKDAIVLFEEILDHDKEDHLRAKEQIVRCHLDNADAVNARLILEKYADDRSTFLMFSRALIEYLSCHLKETGSSEKLRDEALKLANEANPYIIWLIAYYDIFDVILEENGEDLLDDMIQHNLNKSGSVEEAFTFFKNDAAIWMEIDGIVDWIQNHIVEHELTPPEVTVTLPENIPTEEEIEEDPEKQLDMFHAMYLDMFKTGCDEIEERLIGGEGAGK